MDLKEMHGVSAVRGPHGESHLQTVTTADESNSGLNRIRVEVSCSDYS